MADPTNAVYGFRDKNVAETLKRMALSPDGPFGGSFASPAGHQTGRVNQPKRDPVTRVYVVEVSERVSPANSSPPTRVGKGKGYILQKKKDSEDLEYWLDESGNRVEVELFNLCEEEVSKDERTLAIQDLDGDLYVRPKTDVDRIGKIKLDTCWITGQNVEDQEIYFWDSDLSVLVPATDDDGNPIKVTGYDPDWNVLGVPDEWILVYNFGTPENPHWEPLGEQGIYWRVAIIEEDIECGKTGNAIIQVIKPSEQEGDPEDPEGTPECGTALWVSSGPPVPVWKIGNNECEEGCIPVKPGREPVDDPETGAVDTQTTYCGKEPEPPIEDDCEYEATECKVPVCNNWDTHICLKKDTKLYVSHIGRGLYHAHKRPQLLYIGTLDADLCPNDDEGSALLTPLDSCEDLESDTELFPNKRTFKNYGFSGNFGDKVFVVKNLRECEDEFHAINVEHKCRAVPANTCADTFWWTVNTSDGIIQMSGLRLASLMSCDEPRFYDQYQMVKEFEYGLAEVTEGCTEGSPGEEEEGSLSDCPKILQDVFSSFRLIRSEFLTKQEVFQPVKTDVLTTVHKDGVCLYQDSQALCVFAACEESLNEEVFCAVEFECPSPSPSTEVTVVTDDYTIKRSDTFVAVDASAKPIRIFLLPASDYRGQLDIKKIDSTANKVTIEGNIAEPIDGSVKRIITQKDQTVTVQPDQARSEYLIK